MAVRGLALKLPRLYPIVDVASLATRGLAPELFVRQLIAGGAEIVQLRDKSGAPREILRHAAAISAAVKGTGCMPVMNDRVDLALLAGWAAVHLGHKDLPPEAARAVFGGRALVVGVSTHNEAQVAAANAGPAHYLAIGPVFRTATKADAEPAVGLEGVRRARALTHKPLVAIGGITRRNAVAVVEAGADAVAVIGALVQEGEPVETIVRDFLRRLR